MAETDTDLVSVKFECKKCGGKQLRLPDDYDDNSIASCANCGTEFGTWGAVRAAARGVVKDDLVKNLRGAMKRAGWKTR